MGYIVQYKNDPMFKGVDEYAVAHISPPKTTNYIKEATLFETEREAIEYAKEYSFLDGFHLPAKIIECEDVIRHERTLK